MELDTANEWANVIKALAHPTRLQIVYELLKGTKCVAAIEEMLPASQSNISQHLTVLRNATIVDFVQNGSQRCYYLCRPCLVRGIVTTLDSEAVVRKTKQDIELERKLSGKTCESSGAE